MGCKKLKAVAVRRNQIVPIANAEELIKIRKGGR
jgi:aldehyde:ferredoxin oxidoreductase